jgi:hypothetical protein
VEHDAEREHVGPLVLRRAAPLLRRHVRGGAAVDLAAAERVRQAEVEHLHPAVRAEEHVAGLEIAVCDAGPVRVGEGAGDLDGDADALGGGEPLAPEARLEGLAAEQLEDEVGALLAPADVVQRHDVRVGEAGGRLRLEHQPLGAERGPPPRPHDLERDGPAQVAVAGLPDHPERAAADLADELEPADRGARGERRPAAVGRLGRAGELGQEPRERARGDPVLHRLRQARLRGDRSPGRDGI